MQGPPVPLGARVFQRLERFWFAQARASHLAMLRWLIGGYALYYLTSRYAMLVHVAGSFVSMYEPVGAASLFPTPLPQLVFEWVLILTIITNVAFVLGWSFRLSGPLFGLLFLFVLCYRNSWSVIYHWQNLLVLHVLIIGFTQAADVWSVDAVVRWCREKWQCVAPVRNPVNDPHGHWQYGWPIRLLCTATALTYFLAGVAKIGGPLGWSWATGEAFRRQVAMRALSQELLVGWTAPWGFEGNGHPWLFTVMGVAALALELMAPIVIFGRRIPRLWAVVAFAFHWSVFFIMGMQFHYQLVGVAFAPFFVCLGTRKLPSQQSSQLEPLPLANQDSGPESVAVPDAPEEEAVTQTLSL